METVSAIDLGEPLSAGRLLHQRQPSTSVGSTSSTVPPRSLSAYPPSELLANLRTVFATDDDHQSPLPPPNGPAGVLSSYVDPEETVSSVVEGRDELTWSSKRIAWTRGVQLVRSFTFEGRGHVRQAFFAWFDISSTSRSGGSAHGPEGRASPDASSANVPSPPVASVHQSRSRQGANTFSSAISIASSSASSIASADGPNHARAVCFVYGDELEIHFASGDRHVVHLPFPLKRAWPLNLGILMQASPSESEEVDALGYPTEQPSLYSLTDRFGEARPVAQGSTCLPSCSRGETTGTAGSLGTGAEILLVASRSSSVPIVVARTALTGGILVFSYRARDALAAATAPPARLSPPAITQPSLPPLSRPRGRPSLDQVRRRNSSLGPSDSFTIPASGTAIRSVKTPVSGGTRSASEPDPMFSKMSRGVVPASLDPAGIQDRRLSLGRADLNRSMDRMVLDGELDDLGVTRPTIGITSVEEEVGGLELTVVYSLPQAARSPLEAFLSPVGPSAASLSILDCTAQQLSTFDVASTSSTGDPTCPAIISIAPAGSRPALSATSNYSTPTPGLFVLDDDGVLVQLASATGFAKTVRPPSRSRGPDSHIGDLALPALQLNLASSQLPRTHTTSTPLDSVRAAPSAATHLTFANGSSMTVKLPREPNGLVGRCLDALDFVLDSQEAAHLRNGLARIGGGRASEWSPFVRQVLSLVGLGEETSSVATSEPVRPWERLQKSSIHVRDSALVALHSAGGRPQSTDKSLPSSRTSFAVDLARLAVVTRALHLVAEDCKLSLTRLVDLEKLGPLVARLAAASGRDDWVDYWFRSVPCRTEADWYRPSHGPSDLLPAPPDIYAHLSSMLHRRSGMTPWTGLAGLSALCLPGLALRKDPCVLTNGLIAVYAELGKASSSTDPIAQAADAVRCIVSQGITLETLLQMPFGVSLPLHEVIRACQASPPSDWPAAAYELVQRPDMANRIGINIAGRTRRSDLSLDTTSITSLTAAVIPKRAAPALSSTTASSASSREQTLRFGSDRRVEEVERMLSTTRTVTISLPTQLNLTDQEVTAAQKAAALSVGQRTAAISVGQGVFAFGTCSATLTRSWPIPPIDLSVRVLPQGVVPAVDTATLGEGARDWSNFHNGVAAGLRISPETPAVDSSWVVFNRPAEQGSTHAGFLLGLGLTGHLRGMMPWHAFPYLDSRHDFTSIGLLLGLASSYAGSQDALLTKILSLHVHALLPYGSRELNASPLTQAAALLGIGILYTGSRNRKMAEVALGEIARCTPAPQDPLNDYREAYAFSAAMSFGMVMVGQGGTDRNPRDLEMVSQLRLGIFGSSPAASTNKDSIVDVNITGPGATAALGLMYLRSDRQDMADILDLPRSRFDLDLVRPDILLVRTLSRSLILWSSISPSSDWVESNVPSFIRSALRKRKRDGVALDHGVETAYFNILAGACFAVGLKYAGTARSAVHSLLLHYYDLFWKASNVAPTSFEHRIRLSTARACLDIVAISLAVVMAGTGELSVLSRLRLAHGQTDKGVSFGSHMAVHMALGILFLGGGRYTLGSSDAAIAAMVCAFFPRFNHAQGDNLSYPQAYRHLWALAVEPRCFVAQDVDSGESVYLPIKVKLEEDGVVGSHHLISPTLLPPLDRLVSVKIDSPRYWPVHLNPVENDQDRSTLTQNDPVCVKRRAGFLSYAADPKGNRSIFVQAGLIGAAPDLGPMTVSRGSSAVGLEAVRDLVPSLTPDPFLVAFFRRLCAGSSKPSPPESMSTFAGAAFLECLISDQPQILRLHLQVHQLRFARPTTPSLLLLLRNLQMAQRRPSTSDSHLSAYPRSATASSPIVRTSLLRQVESSLAALVSETRTQSSFRSQLTRYARSETLDGRLEHQDVVEPSQLALYLVSCGVPPPAVLSTLRHLVEEARRQTSQLASDLGGSSPTDHGDLERGLRIVLAATASRVCGPEAQSWEERSVGEVLDCW